jgi:hypothetical protein
MVNMMIEGQTPTAGTAGDVNTPAPSGTPIATPAIEMNTAPSTEAQGFIQWVREDWAAGKMTAAEADAALREINGEGLSQISADRRSESERAYDLAHPIAKVHEIRWPHVPEEDAAAQRTFRNDLNSRFVDAKMPADIATHILKCGQTFQELSKNWTSAGDHALYARSQMAQLESLFGDQLPQKLELGRQIIRSLEAKRPGLVEYLETSGIGNNAGIILQIINHAERLSKRSKP